MMQANPNPFFSFLTGPQFLLLMAGLGVGLVVVSRVMRLVARMGDQSVLQQLHSQKPMVYEAAYLRRGVQGVIETAVFKLAQMSLLSIDDAGAVYRTGPSGSQRNQLDPIELEVLDSVGDGRTVQGLIVDLGLQARIGDQIDQIEGWLIDNRLKVAPEWRSAMAVARYGSILVIALISGARLVGAFVAGRPRVLFLVLLALVLIGSLVWATILPPLTRTGEQWLMTLRQQFMPRGGMAPNADPTTMAYGVALAGPAILAGTAFAVWHTAMMPVAIIGVGGCGACGGCGGCGGGGCGGGCGGGGGGCGGGCGGCGGCGG